MPPKWKPIIIMRFTLDKKKAFVFCLSLLTCLFIKAQDVTLSFAGYDAENEKRDCLF